MAPGGVPVAPEEVGEPQPVVPLVHPGQPAVGRQLEIGPGVRLEGVDVPGLGVVDHPVLRPPALQQGGDVAQALGQRLQVRHDTPGVGEGPTPTRPIWAKPRTTASSQRLPVARNSSAASRHSF